MNNFLTSKENEKNVNEMIIDDKKTILHHFIVNNKTLYSDHCSIIVEMNWHMESKTKEEKYCRIIKKKILTQIQRVDKWKIPNKFNKKKW